MTPTPGRRDSTATPPLSFVIPAYRSERTVVGVIEEIFSEFADAEVVVVVDGSPDSVAAVVRRFQGDHPQLQVRLLELRQNRGQHFAILQGFRIASGTHVATIDDDGQNPAAEYRVLLDRLRERDLDCVYGDPDRFASSASRRWLSRVNRELSVHFMGNRQRIAISNVRVLRADLAKALTETPSPYPFIDALIFRASCHVEALPVAQRRRAAGRSTYSLARLVTLGISHTTIFSTLPLVIVAALGLLVGGLTFAAALALLAARLVGKAPAGEPVLVGLVALLFSMSFANLALLSIYVGRLYVAFNSTPRPFLRPEGGGASG